MGGHESDGVQVPGACTFLFQAGTSLRAAEHLLWSTPAECAPAEMPFLLVTCYRSFFPLASILRCLAATDLNTERREKLAQVSTEIDLALSRLRPLCRAPS